MSGRNIFARKRNAKHQKKDEEMEELKFRGFSSSIGWVYGYAWKGMNDWWYIKRIVWRSSTASYLEDVPVETESVGIYSGHKDKNGVEIYSGSICVRNGHKRVIVFKNGTMYCVPTKKGEVDIDHVKAIHDGWYLENFLSDIEVVGCVYPVASPTPVKD